MILVSCCDIYLSYLLYFYYINESIDLSIYSGIEGKSLFVFIDLGDLSIEKFEIFSG